MLRNLRQIEGRPLQAKDGIIGQVEDVYFDDQHWHVRYLVVATGTWLKKRRVLIAAEAFHGLDWGLQVFPVELTKEQVRNSPNIDADKPVFACEYDSGIFDDACAWGTSRNYSFILKNLDLDAPITFCP